MYGVTGTKAPVLSPAYKDLHLAGPLRKPGIESIPFDAHSLALIFFFFSFFSLSGIPMPFFSSRRFLSIVPDLSVLP